MGQTPGSVLNSLDVTVSRELDDKRLYSKDLRERTTPEPRPFWLRGTDFLGLVTPQGFGRVVKV